MSSVYSCDSCHKVKDVTDLLDQNIPDHIINPDLGCYIHLPSGEPYNAKKHPADLCYTCYNRAWRAFYNTFGRGLV